MNEEAEFKVYGYRWVVLIFFGLVLVIQAFLWISFAPIESAVEKALGVSTMQVRLLALVGPFMFIIISSYAGSLADRRGFKFATGIGVIMMCAAGIIKAVTPHVISSGDAQYWIYFFMQMLGGTGSAFAIANLSKMPIKWFPENQRALGTGLTTMWMYLGTVIGLPLVAIVANVPEKARLALTPVSVLQADLNRVLLVVAIIVGAVSVLFFLFVKEDPPTPSGAMPEVEEISLRKSFPRFMRIASFRAMCFISLIGYGIYMALTVTMEKIITYHGAGFTASFASFVAAGITLGGIVGAAVIPEISEKVGLRKPFLILATLITMPTVFLIAFIGNKPIDLTSGIVMGLFLLPALPIIFTMVGEMEEIGPRLAATAVGILFAIGSIGSVLIPYLMEILSKKKPGDIVDYRWAILMLAALGLIGLFVIIFWVKETGPKKRAKSGQQIEQPS
jgi:MFS family permease